MKAEIYLPVNKKNIFKKTSQESIFSFYTGFEVKEHVKYSSPFRRDENPSCSFIYSRRGILYFKDWSRGNYWDCFGFVMKKFKVGFREAMNRINKDMHLGLGTTDTTLKGVTKTKEANQQKVKEVRTDYEVYPVSWKSPYLSYWSAYHICLDTLRKYGVVPVKFVYKDKELKWTSSPHSPIYAYVFGFNKYKLYRPKGSKNSKWRAINCGEELQGYAQLPQKSKLLIITSSLKDVMVLSEMGIPAVAPQGEEHLIDEETINDLSNRFETILTFMDNDDAGICAGNKYFKAYGFSGFNIPLNLGVKDVSDLVVQHGFKKAWKTVKKCIKNTVKPRNEDIPFM